MSRWNITGNKEMKKILISFILLNMVCVVSAQPWKNKGLETIKPYQQPDLKKYGILTPEEIQKGSPSPHVDRLNPSHLTPPTPEEIEMQNIYNVFIPTIIKNDSLPNNIFEQLPVYRDRLYKKVISREVNYSLKKETIQKPLSVLAGTTGNKRMQKEYRFSSDEDVEARGVALLSYAVISDAQPTIGLVKQFLDKGYGLSSGLADSYAIMTCLILGEDGERYLLELAKQRENEGMIVSSGWAYVKSKMPDLELSDDLIGNFEEERIDANKLEEWRTTRAIVQEKLTHNNKK